VDVIEFTKALRRLSAQEAVDFRRPRTQAAFDRLFQSFLDTQVILELDLSGLSELASVIGRFYLTRDREVIRALSAAVEAGISRGDPISAEQAHRLSRTFMYRSDYPRGLFKLFQEMLTTQTARVSEGGNLQIESEVLSDMALAAVTAQVNLPESFYSEILDLIARDPNRNDEAKLSQRWYTIRAALKADQGIDLSLPDWVVRSDQLIGGGNPSPTERVVSKVNEKYNLGFEVEAILEDFISVDFVHREKKIVIQIDGAIHSLSDGTLSLKDQLHDRILQSRGWRIHRIRSSSLKSSSDGEIYQVLWNILHSQ